MMSHVLADRPAEGVLRLRLDRPAKKNALTVEMYAALVDAFEAAATDGTRALLLASSGPDFTAGNDLADFLARPPEDESAPVFRFVSALATLPVPLVVSVRGFAVGIGTTLLLHADAAYAAPDARLLVPFAALGLTPEAASSFLLPLRVGPAKAAEMLLLGAPVTGEEAAAHGLVTASVDDPDAAALAAATRLAALPPEAARQTKALLRSPHAEAVRATLHREAATFLARLQDPATQAILRARLTR